MGKMILKEMQIQEILNDAGMASEQTELLLQSFCSGHSEHVRQILFGYRQELLSSIHEKHDRLFRLDLLIRQMNLNGKHNEKEFSNGDE